MCVRLCVRVCGGCLCAFACKDLQLYKKKIKKEIKNINNKIIMKNT